MIKLFLVLQALDFITTIAGFHLGLGESSPAIQIMMALGGPVIGVFISKLIALGLLGLCIRLRKPGAIRKINYFYVTLVTWNLWLIYLVFCSPGELS